MTLKHQFPWNEGMKHPPWPWDQQPIGAQLTLPSFREAIRTLLALGALPRSLNADVWAEPRSGEIQISKKGWSCICHSLMINETENVGGWWISMNIISFNSGTFFLTIASLTWRQPQEMHSRESARVVRQILPAAQGIVARHAAPRFLEHFKA